MVIVCAYCGKSFAAYDNHHRKYCPDCQKSSRRYNEQFQARKKNEPVLKIYTAHYSKGHALYKKKRISKDVLDSWRHEAILKQHAISVGEITVEDFAEWCKESYQLLKSGKESRAFP